MTSRRITGGNGPFIFACLLLTEICSTTFSSSCDSVTFRKLPGYHMTSPNMYAVKCTDSPYSLMGCVARCGNGRCLAASYNPSAAICQLHKHPINSPEVTFEASPDWDSAQIIQDFVQDGDWILVFRATAGINISAYEAWMTTGRYDDHPAIRPDVPVGCTSVNGSHFCDRHFRSKLLDTWDSSSIELVKLVFYKNGVAMMTLLFGGTGSSSKSWFSIGTLISSDWKDVAPASFNYFSLEGDDDLSRRWFINAIYDGCPYDIGWLMVLDQDLQKARCDWELLRGAGYPKFFYAQNKERIVWNTGDFGEADVMAVFVQTGRSESRMEI